MKPIDFCCSLLIHFAAVAGAANAAGIEVVVPPARDSSLHALAMIEDPLRPAPAPTAAAIESVTAESGAGAGLVMAQRALRESQLAYGAQDARTIPALINHANAQQRAGNTVESLHDYRLAQQLAEAQGGPRDERLIAAWRGIAHTHLLAGQFESALTAYASALQLARVNLGLYNREQLDMLHGLAMAQRAGGDLDAAASTQMRRLETAERIFGAGTPQAARLYVAVGTWLRDAGRVTDAIGLHALAVDILEAQGRDEPSLIEPLIEAAISGGERELNFDQSPLPRNAHPRRNLERAEALADADRAAGTAVRVERLIRIGDVYLLQRRRSDARRAYQKAMILLPAGERERRFDKPEFLRFQPPAAPPVAGPGGAVVAEFTVAPDGNVHDLRIIESESAAVEPELASRLRRALRAACLRPRMVKGESVETRGVRYLLPVRGQSA